ncbi:MAG: 16S rRNA processing protein RimM [Lachnospiraceae bacterium]|nr:16S rRNA processing protein RimM [Lachnospiraceae bacterium]MBR4278035.1 16S rRNA processing protein RimM [Lachnospiraceae bacterium]MBR6303348.1 16S rRNA processing protein RimM [Lachnospiraceae bacterium]
MEDYFKIGIITSSHGVRGEMKVYPTTDDARRFKKLKQVFVETKEGFKVFEVESARVSDKVLLKLKGIDTPEEVVKYRQRGIFVDRKNAVRLSKDEYFIADLIGIKVICDDGKELGVLKEVMPTGANDVYVVSMDEGKEVLIPAIKDCILDVDVEEGFMKVHLLDGLLD